ncbi:MAG: CDP-alcohol phosphatidyltransferase family protein, partial [Dehalococcoidales bacterium]|nr:CDP-alcohol phosphatidyltransferase family protein [Dehalococcoidales bacterium]
MTKLPETRKAIGYNLTRPIIHLLARTSITPNALSWFGLVLTGIAVALVVTGHLVTAGVMVLVAGFFDILDGALARGTNRITKFGGVLDSTL